MPNIVDDDQANIEIARQRFLAERIANDHRLARALGMLDLLCDVCRDPAAADDPLGWQGERVVHRRCGRGEDGRWTDPAFVAFAVAMNAGEGCARLFELRNQLQPKDPDKARATEQLRDVGCFHAGAERRSIPQRNPQGDR